MTFRAVVFDFETTGLVLHPATPLRKQPKPIEFGAVLVELDGTVVDECSLLINPEQPIEAVITKITGLTDADLAVAPVFAAVLPRIREIMGKADVMVAHNLPFDESILEIALQREGITDFIWPKYKLCTVQAYQEGWGKRPRLIELYEQVMGKPLLQTHRASDDCLALADIVIKEGLLDDFTTATAATH